MGLFSQKWTFFSFSSTIFIKVFTLKKNVLSFLTCYGFIHFFSKFEFHKNLKIFQKLNMLECQTIALKVEGVYWYIKKLLAIFLWCFSVNLKATTRTFCFFLIFSISKDTFIYTKNTITQLHKIVHLLSLCWFFFLQSKKFIYT